MTATIQDMQAVVNQLAGMGTDLVKTLTPAAIGAAKLTALSDLLFYFSPWGIAIVAFFLFFVFLILARLTSDHDDARCIIPSIFVILCAAAFAISILVGLLNLCNLIIAVYGYHHPDVYLAYQAYQKILDT
jgi:hypothetical protein